MIPNYEEKNSILVCLVNECLWRKLQRRDDVKHPGICKQWLIMAVALTRQNHNS